MNDRIYIIADCETGQNDIEIDFFDGHNWQKSWHDYNWQCLESRLYISQWLNYNDTYEFEVFTTINDNYNMNNYYGFNVYCGEKPKITQANGVIDCDQVLTGVIDQKQAFFYKIMNNSNASYYTFAGYIDSGSLKISVLDVSGIQHVGSSEFNFGCAKQHLTLKDLNWIDYLAIFNDNEQPTNYSISMQCNPSEIYIGSVTCGDIISGNVTNSDIHSYNIIHDPVKDSDQLYVISSCNTNTEIAISLLQHVYGSINYRHSCPYDYWYQCNHETAALEEWLDTGSNYTIDVFNPFADNDTYYSYEIHVSCGDTPQQQITSADCYIGCGQSVTGYYEYGTPQFCEITSFTKGFGGNIFSGCGSDYNQALNIFGGNVNSEWNSDDQCMDEYQKLNWHVWDDTITYYLQIDGHSSSGNYKVSMDCGVETNLTGEIHCPYDRMEGSVKNNEIAWFKVNFDSDLPATFDGCLSDDDIQISLYDSLLSEDGMQHRDRCIGGRDGYYELYPSNNDTYYIQIRNENDFGIDANLTYNVSYFCEIKRRKSTDYGIMNCGDFISGVIDIGDAHLYTFNSTMDDQIYIISDCNTDKGIQIDYFDGDNWGQSGDEYNWQCESDTPYVSQWINYGDFMEFEIFHNRKPISEAIYGFNIYCGHYEKPYEPMQYAGRINCGDHNILGRNNMFFNFSNPETQTVTFSVCSISFDGVLNLNESNGDAIMSKSAHEWSYYDYNDPFYKDCPHLKYNSLPAGNYTFESKRERESGIFLLDVLCDVEYEPPNPKILQSNIADNSCNYFVRDDSVVPMDVCIGSHDGDGPSEGGWSKKYTCVNGEAVILAYNTSNCDSVPRHDKDNNTSFAEYNCNATESCPYVLMTFYPMVYDMNIHDYICVPDMSSWHRWAEVIDFCRIRMEIGFTSSIIEYKDGNATESYYVGYDCGITAPIQSEYVYRYNVLRNHHCCSEDIQSQCEEMGDGPGAYFVSDYHSSVDTFASTLDSFTTTLTNSNKPTPSNSALLTTTADSNELKTTYATILLTKLRTNSTDKDSTEITASSCFIIELKWIHILMVILMVMNFY